MRKFLVVMFFVCFVLWGCDSLPHPDLYQFVREFEVKHPSDRAYWIFADLKGDGRDMVISTERNQVGSYGLYVSDAHGKIISQLNFPYRIRGLQSLTDPSNNSRWLFYSYNDQKRVFLSGSVYSWQTPLQRTDYQFEFVTRADSLTMRSDREYFANIYPELIDDIDQDGRYELVCRMLDGFSATPRGLLVYDLESKKIKWRYDTPCNLSSVLCGDFDGNGTKELVISTMAMKNTLVSTNNLNDANGFVLVLSAQGKKLFQQHEFEDYGQSRLNAADINQDGKPEIYNVVITWGHEKNQNNLAVMNWNGANLISSLSRTLPSTLDRSQNDLFLVKLDNSTRYKILLVDRVKGMLVMDDQLDEIPIKAPVNISYLSKVCDLDQDGRMELLALNTDDQMLVLNSSFKVNAKLQVPFSADDSAQLLILRNGEEEKPLITLSSPHEIAVFSYRLLPLPRLIIHLIENYILQICILLLLIVLYLRYRFKVWKSMVRNFFNLPGIGFLYVRNLNRIASLNITARSFAYDGNNPECDDLKACFPNLHKYLGTFSQSCRNIESITAALASDEQTLCRISMIHVPGLTRKDVIAFIPINKAEENIMERVQWADTARRLSHHVRRHLTNILLASDAIKAKNNDQHGEYLQIIRDEIDKVRIFTHSFQRFTELKGYDLRLMDIIPSVEHCLGTCQIPENIRLVKSWNLSSICAQIEPIRFEEAVMNVITNALEAMPNGGSLHILINEMTASTLGSDHDVLLEIEDTGCGIPAKYLEDIWKPFFTTKPSGTGIGIPESRKIIESIGGRMDIQSEEKVGTTVSIWLKGETRG